MWPTQLGNVPGKVHHLGLQRSIHYSLHMPKLPRPDSPLTLRPASLPADLDPRLAAHGVSNYESGHEHALRLAH